MVQKELQHSACLSESMKNDTNNNFDGSNVSSTYIGLVNSLRDSHGEKHVTISEELPLLYKPKSFSVPDLLSADSLYHKAQHEHPSLKHSIYKASSDIDVRKFIRKQSINPFERIKMPVKWTVSSPVVMTKWKKNAISKDIGQSCLPSNNLTKAEKNCKQYEYSSRLKQSNDQNIGRHEKILQFISKVNIFKKQKRIRRKSASYKIQQNMIDNSSTCKLIEQKTVSNGAIPAENIYDSGSYPSYMSYSRSSNEHSSDESCSDEESLTTDDLNGKVVASYTIGVPKTFELIYEKPRKFIRSSSASALL